MGRLTIWDNGNEEILVNEEERLLSSKGYIDKDEMYKIMRHLAEKLFEYEDAEEQGLLLRLPYPVGTQLYFAYSKQGIIKDRIRRWQLNNKGLMFCSNGSAYRVDAIGKSVFLTYEEAELRFRELKDEIILI